MGNCCARRGIDIMIIPLEKNLSTTKKSDLDNKSTLRVKYSATLQQEEHLNLSKKFLNYIKDHENENNDNGNMRLIIKDYQKGVIKA